MSKITDSKRIDWGNPPRERTAKEKSWNGKKGVDPETSGISEKQDGGRRNPTRESTGTPKLTTMTG